MENQQSAQIVKKLTGGGARSLLLGNVHKYAEKIKRKRSAVLNQEFLVLQTIAIISVVIGHQKYGALNYFSDWFPIYSYHMPLFMFISGYFYRTRAEEKVDVFILQKIKTLLVPYYLWRIFYAVFTTIFSYMGFHFGKTINFYVFFCEPWIFDQSFQPMIPAWFVLVLFCVQIVFVLLHKLLRQIFKNEIMSFVLLLALGLGGVLLAKNIDSKNILSLIVRISFFLPCYYFGYLYKAYLERRDTLPSIFYFSILLLVQMVLLKFFKPLTMDVYRIKFSSYLFVPYLTSLTGILFWLRVSKILARALKKNRIVRYIGQNTWTIMMHHIVSFFFVNCIIFGLSKPFDLSGFNIDVFKSNMWYTYSPGLAQFAIVYVVAGVALPLLAKYGFEKFVLYLDKRAYRFIKTEQT